MPKLGKPKPAAKPQAKALEILYPRYETRIFTADPDKAPLDAEGNPDVVVLCVKVAKTLLGWQTEADASEQAGTKVKFDSDYLLTDFAGNKVRCLSNVKNRPFYPQLAEDWKLETLRRKWVFNGEPIIIDEIGMNHDGQHRLIGLILANQEWEADKAKPKPEQQWQTYWDKPPYMETLVVLGISGADSVVNTINTGKRRTDIDVLYRCEQLEGESEKVRLAMSKIVAYATRLIWERTSQRDFSLAPKRPHSELFEWLERHPSVWKAAKVIYEAAEGNKLGQLIGLGYAAGLLYLMGVSASDPEGDYTTTNSEKSLNLDLWEKAEEFWVDVADNGEATEQLRESLLGVPSEVGGSFGKNLRCGSVIKAWALYSDGKKVQNVSLKLGEDPETGQVCVAEFPRLGGIDVEYEAPPKPEKTEKPAKPDKAPQPQKPAKAAAKAPEQSAPASKGECPKGGKHVFVKDEEGEYCEKCLEPKTVKRKVL
jgi:hypothetical protein